MHNPLDIEAQSPLYVLCGRVRLNSALVSCRNGLGLHGSRLSAVRQCRGQSEGSAAGEPSLHLREEALFASHEAG